MFSKSRDEFSQNDEEFKAKNWQPVTTEQGEEMKNKIGAFAYIECNAKYNYNVNEVFELAVKLFHYLKKKNENGENNSIQKVEASSKNERNKVQKIKEKRLILAFHHQA